MASLLEMEIPPSPEVLLKFRTRILIKTWGTRANATRQMHGIINKIKKT